MRVFFFGHRFDRNTTSVGFKSITTGRQRIGSPFGGTIASDDLVVFSGKNQKRIGFFFLFLRATRARGTIDDPKKLSPGCRGATVFGCVGGGGARDVGTRSAFNGDIAFYGIHFAGSYGCSLPMLEMTLFVLALPREPCRFFFL